MASPPYLLVISVLCFASLLHGKLTAANVSSGTEDGSETWGYVEVRPKAHMFWWHYKSPHRVDSLTKPWPTILWLQGGPGASGVGIGNFQEVGPLDTRMMPRNSTWLLVADLLFVDNPVGTGFSYVEDKEDYVKSDLEAGNDLTALLMALSNGKGTLSRTSPLYVVAESYGGKYAVTLALSAVDAITAGKLKIPFGGIALGDSWISPQDYVFSWASLLKDMSRLDDNGVKRSNRIAWKIGHQIRGGQYANATQSWSDLESEISTSSNGVDFYNLLLDSSSGDSISSSDELQSHKTAKKGLGLLGRYTAAASLAAGGGVDMDAFMNGPVRKKLGIIPQNVSWGGQADAVFEALSEEFMKPVIKEVDKLLKIGVNVTVYNGQVDLICATKGTEAWIKKLTWEGLKAFLVKERTALYCDKNSKVTTGFTKAHKNFKFYWILNAGHFVPVDQACTALNMVGAITQSPSRAIQNRGDGPVNVTG